MKAVTASGSVVGRGSATSSLTTGDMAGIIADALRDVPQGARVLAVIPDRTRDDNTAILFPLVSQQLARSGATRLDALVAQGTHAAMADAEKRAKIGWGDAEIPMLGEVFDHHWDRPDALMMLLNCAATYAVATDAAMPKTVAIRPIQR